MNVPTSRADAKRTGAKAYFTGKACPRGHVALRRTSNGECVECGRAGSRARAKAVSKDVKSARDAAHRERHREAINARKRQKHAERPYRNTEAEARWNASDEGRAYKRKWTAANKEKLNALARQWKVANAEAVKAAKAEYYRRNPHISRLEAHRRRARQAGADGAFTQADVDRIFAAQGHKCACCRGAKKLTIDHVVPLARGGSNWPSNLQGLCGPCNSRKQARDPAEFMRLMEAHT